MAKPRVFPKRSAKTKAEDYYGGCNFTGASPDLYERGIKSLNLEIPFEDALKLSLAVQACLQSLNRYNRGTAVGRSMGMLLSIKMDNSSVTILEKGLPSLRR
jgi:hypothetical protein